jgi:hypothetical protein
LANSAAICSMKSSGSGRCARVGVEVDWEVNCDEAATDMVAATAANVREDVLFCLCSFCSRSFARSVACDA